MLDAFFKQAYEVQKRTTFVGEIQELLKQLPDEDLSKLAAGMSIKEACMGPSGDGGDFLEHFKGSPLLEQAIALEQEEIQADMLDMQRREESRARMQEENQVWDLKDKIRLKRRLLELQLAKEQSGMAGAPMSAAPPAASPDAPAQGAGAPGAVPAEGVQDSSQGLMGKTSSPSKGSWFEMPPTHPKLQAAYDADDAATTPQHKAREFLSTVGGGAVGAGAGAAIGGGGALLMKALGGNADPRQAALLAGMLMGSAGMGLGSLLGGSHGEADVAKGKTHERVFNMEQKYAAEKAAFADAMGREMARADAEQIELRKVAEQAGALMAKEALGLGAITGALGKLAPMASKAVGFAAKNPALTGAAIGAAGGALAGGEGHRLSGALTGGALGAGAGHAAGGIAKGMQGGQSFLGAAKSYGGGLADKAKGLVGAGGSPGGRATMPSMNPSLTTPSLAPPNPMDFAKRNMFGQPKMAMTEALIRGIPQE